MIRRALFLLLLTTEMQMFAKTSPQTVLEEVRVALNDMRQAHATQKMDLALMQEDIEKLKKTSGCGNKSFEERVSQLENMQQKILTDLRQLSGSTNQIAQSLSILEKQIANQNERLNEVVKLKSTLNSISKAIGTPGSTGNTYKVEAGDTLEKIARKYNTSIEALKRANGLTSSTIIVGQQLRIPG